MPVERRPSFESAGGKQTLSAERVVLNDML